MEQYCQWFGTTVVDPGRWVVAAQQEHCCLQPQVLHKQV